MPIYEYVCPEDGSVLSLLRPMSDADAPVEDPEGRGRHFSRRHSTFATPGGQIGPPQRAQGGGCACGKPHGSCGRGPG
jgi:putative FmdB family regulatory protein